MRFYRETEFQEMSIGKIPKDWAFVKLEDAAKVTTGGNAPQGKQHFEEGKYPFVRVQHFDGNRLFVNKWDMINEKAVKEYGLKLLPKDSIVFPKSGASINLEKRALLPLDSFVVSHLCVLIPKKEVVDYRFLFYLMKKITFSKNSAGTTLPYLNLEYISKVRVPIAPIEEQRNIVGVLGVADSAIELADKVIAKTERLKKGLMQKLLTRGIEHTEYKNTPIGRIPKEWSTVPCSDVCREITVGIVVTPAKYYTPSGIPCLRSFNIQENEIDSRDLVYISKQSNELHRKSIIHSGDVVAVRTGKTGVASVVPKTFDGANCVDLIIMRPNETIEPFFLSWFLNSSLAKAQVLAGQSGSVQKHFNIEMVKKLIIARPSISEQKKISSILSTANERLKMEMKEKAKLEKIKLGLMDLLLSGKVRIKAD